MRTAVTIAALSYWLRNSPEDRNDIAALLFKVAILIIGIGTAVVEDFQAIL